MDFPARSIIGLHYCGGECGTEACPAVVITCDCAESCHLTVEVPETGTHEIAYTCDGCHSVTWFTVTQEAA